MVSLQTLLTLAIGASAAFLVVHAQCLQNAGYLGAYDATTGDSIGAVIRSLINGDLNPWITMTEALDTSGNTSNYLAVLIFSTACNDGGPVYIQILSPGDPNAGYVSLVSGTTECNEVFLIGANPFLALVAADGFPHGAYPMPAPTESTFAGGYGDLTTDCGENQIFALGSAIKHQVLLPGWTDPNGAFHAAVPIMFDTTSNILLAAPDPATYSAVTGQNVVQVVWSIPWNASQSGSFKFQYLSIFV
ncbi:hypothetical protein DFH07DRAFT_769317 [Mycena maculata]|uniref:Uncharacterized protein n=1 Tax=Mycena maculata TaxID=230809 RepID=A0AAD7JQ53_9AGAR|nr:hypothetical protein DFH07DRAFT_769317 [Mycena maculata]